ncbi:MULTISPECIES: DUF397 domain-containing protein [unclassified Streptomyces]|uniref:DUF397 domain-containing protein n=1 Tax=unclassified Streptomyces TaxID=2593676 RepID=UPI00037EF67E|nr:MULTISPECIES: DUF397 domain-containing protein [unclassified Streptomyces]MYY05727.1 DUF397 domain-containing protein [Streptomyces sp. SID4913]
MQTRADDLGVSWFRSSYSNDQGGACVEGGRLPNGQMAIRDSKVPHGAAVVFPAASWSQFISGVSGERFIAS